MAVIKFEKRETFWDYTLVPRYLRGLSILYESERLELELEESELDAVLVREKLGLGLGLMMLPLLPPTEEGEDCRRSFTLVVFCLCWKMTQARMKRMMHTSRTPPTTETAVAITKYFSDVSTAGLAEG